MIFSKLKRVKGCLIALAGMLGLATTSSTQAVPIDLALVLAVDVSTSVDATEFNLQRQGYVDAFNSASIASAISSGAYGQIAVSLVYWSTGQTTAVPWTLIDGNAGTTAADFATLVNGAARPGTIGNTTGIAGAIDYSQGLIAGIAGYEPTRSVIDVSGDGGENVATDQAVRDARDAAVGAGTAINGLAIGTAGLLTYYTDNVIGGSGSFALQATNFATFGAAIDDKLVREISGVPEPETLPLIMLALVSLFVARKRHLAAA